MFGIFDLCFLCYAKSKRLHMSCVCVLYVVEVNVMVMLGIHYCVRVCNAVACTL